MKQFLINTNAILINGLTKITTMDKGEIMRIV